MRGSFLSLHLLDYFTHPCPVFPNVLDIQNFSIISRFEIPGVFSSQVLYRVLNQKTGTHFLDFVKPMVCGQAQFFALPSPPLGHICLWNLLLPWGYTLFGSRWVFHLVLELSGFLLDLIYGSWPCPEVLFFTSYPLLALSLQYAAVSTAVRESMGILRRDYFSTHDLSTSESFKGSSRKIEAKICCDAMDPPIILGLRAQDRESEFGGSIPGCDVYEL